MSTETKSGIYDATGRRKNAIARVRLVEGSKEQLVNKRTLEAYFPDETLRMIIRQPFELTQTESRFGIKIDVSGGGLSGQAGAVRLGISRALVLFDPALKSVFRKNGLLTRDPRKKERKKFGRKKARRSFQFTKR